MKFMCLGVLLLFVSACAPRATTVAIPANTGPRLDLQIQSVDGQVGSAGSSVQALLEDAVARHPAFSSWFFIVDRVTSPEETVYLVSHVNHWSTDSRQGGTRKYGFYTIYDHSAEVTLELIDVASGRVLGLGSGRGKLSVNKENTPSDQLRVVRYAFEKAVNTLLIQYTGGS